LIQIVGAVVLREIRVQRRYPLSMINLVLLTPLYEMALPTLLLGSAFLVDGSAVGLARMVGTDDLVGWLGLGVLVASMVAGAVWSVSGTLEADRDTGVLEHSWATPAPREAYVIGAVATGTMFGLGASAILVGFAVVFLGASYSIWGAVLCVPVAALMVVGTCGLGYLTAAATLAMRRAEGLLNPLMLLIITFSGVAFPLTLLPQVARYPTYLLPSMWGVDIFRHLTMQTTPMEPLPIALVALAASSTALFLFGRWVFLRAEFKLRTGGTLSQF
jgi:ABC-type polysaccharide/polyol phosphate export permease